MATDAEIRAKGIKFLPKQKYLQNPYEFPVEEEETAPVSGGITNTNAFTNSGGNSGGYYGSTDNLINNFNSINQDKYFSNQQTPNVDGLDQSMRDKTFMGMRSYNENQDVNPVDAGEYLAAGQDIPTNFSPTYAGRVQETLGRGKDLLGKGVGMAFNAAIGIPGLSYALGKLDNFNTLPAMDREFINQNKNYTGPTIFGENTGNQDPFGINTRSAFGNYAQHSRDMAAIDGDLAAQVEDQIARGLTNTLQMKQLNFHREKQKQAAIDLEIAQSKAAADNDRATNPNFEREAAKGNKGADFTGGRFDGAKDKASYDRDPTGYSGSSKDGGLIGYGGKSGTPVYQQYLNGGRAGYFFGGRVNFKNGGLASIL